MQGHDGNLLVREQAYREKLVAKMARDDKINMRPNLAETSIAGAAAT